jgi:hypothetical protein
MGVCSILSEQIHGHFLILKYTTIYVLSVNKSVWNLCVQFLFTYVCFTDLIIAGYLCGYTGKRYISFIMQPASTYLTCNIIPQWFKVGQPCTTHYCVGMSPNMYLLFFV